MSVFERFGVPGPDDVLHRIEGMAEALRLLQDFFSVGHQDVTPDGGVAGRDAREVAKARPAERQEVAPCRLARDGIEEREGKEVRQVAHRGEGGVVVLRVMRSTCAPIAAQTSVARWTSSGEVFCSGVRITCRPR